MHHRSSRLAALVFTGLLIGSAATPAFAGRPPNRPPDSPPGQNRPAQPPPAPDCDIEVDPICIIIGGD